MTPLSSKAFRFNTSFAYFCCALLAGTMLCLLLLKHSSDLAHAKQAFFHESKIALSQATVNFNTSINQIHQNLRTISFLPSVRKIDRYGKNLNDDSLQSIQQIYNNLASSVAVSEVYIIPLDIDADKIDPLTNKPYEPILMFDQLIIGDNTNSSSSSEEAAEEEVEIHEYRQLKEHMSWFRTNTPSLSGIDAINLPMISGPQIITCDNTEYNSTKNDADRMGIMFSVPFFDTNGTIKGAITAIVRNNELRKLIPPHYYSLVNTKYDYVNFATDMFDVSPYSDAINQGTPAKELLFSDIETINSFDPRSEWIIWAGKPDDVFYSSREYSALTNFKIFGIIAILLITCCIAVVIRIIDQTFKKQQRNQMQLEETLATRTAEIEKMAQEREEKSKQLEIEKLQAQSDLENRIDSEIGTVVNSTIDGDFSQRVPLASKSGFMLKLAEQINAISETSEKSLNELLTVLGSLAKGDLTKRLLGDHKGMYQDMQHAANQTASQLNKVITQLKLTVVSITDATNIILNGVANLSQRTEQQASSLEQTAASMEELTGTVKQNSVHTKEALKISEQAKSLAEEGGKIVTSVVTSMAGIEDASKKVADIVRVIDDIAFQTNLLALNASVEAARAGEAGKGFAVVATEVRNLASRSASASKEIKELVQASANEVHRGSNLASEAGIKLEEIVNATIEANSFITGIARATEDQSSGILEINCAVSEMDKMTQQNAVLVEENKETIRTLEQQVSALEAVVNSFKIDMSTTSSSKLISHEHQKE